MENFSCTQEVQTYSNLHVWIRKGKIELNPKFQRKFVYTQEEQSNLIESIIMGAVIPQIILVKSNDSSSSECATQKYEVIDGKQRLMSIHRFLGNELKLKLPNNEELNGRYFKDLDADKQDAIECGNINVVILPYEKRHFKFELFMRYNKGMKKLSRQEIRNGSSECFLNTMANEIANDQNGEFFKLTAESIKNHRMEREEYVLQLLAEIAELKDPAVSSYTKSPAKTIDDYITNNASISEEECNDLKQYFNRLFKTYSKIFGNEVVKKGKSGIQKTTLAFLVEFIAVHTDEKNHDRVLLRSKDNLLERARSAAKNVPRNIAVFKEQFSSRGAYVKAREMLFSELEEVLDKSIENDAREFSVEDKLKKYDEQKGVCPICNQHFEYRFMHGDHIIPWASGGSTSYDNLQMLCDSCNLEKSGKTT